MVAQRVLVAEIHSLGVLPVHLGHCAVDDYAAASSKGSDHYFYDRVESRSIVSPLDSISMEETVY